MTLTLLLLVLVGLGRILLVVVLIVVLIVVLVIILVVATAAIVLFLEAAVQRRARCNNLDVCGLRADRSAIGIGLVAGPTQNNARRVFRHDVVVR